MIITDKNIEKLFEVLKKAFNTVGVMQYDGWTNQVNPIFLVDGSDEELNFSKEYASNISCNRFRYAELDDIGNEKYIRLVSGEYDEFDHFTTKNYVINVGNEIYANSKNKQLVIIAPNSPLKKLLGRNDDEFVVFLFDNKERLEELEKFIKRGN